MRMRTKLPLMGWVVMMMHHHHTAQPTSGVPSASVAPRFCGVFPTTYRKVLPPMQQHGGQDFVVSIAGCLAAQPGKADLFGSAGAFGNAAVAGGKVT